MNMKSRSPSENRPSIILSRRQVNDCFVTNNGKEYLPTETPLDNDDRMKRRLVWVRYQHLKLINSFYYVCL